jgi:diguanylate cyclase (GGDEF)-like protein
MMDIDFFKRINDAFGHVTGDEVLKEVVKRSVSALRSYDHIGRFGGEEFLLVLPGAGIEAAPPVFERVRNVVSASPVRVGRRSVDVTVSIGGVVRAGGSIDHLVRSADDALYAAKAQGRNRVVVPGAGLHEPALMAV